eukprot:1160647-Pelagomonas_calceolata.AAC.7
MALMLRPMLAFRSLLPCSSLKDPGARTEEWGQEALREEWWGASLSWVDLHASRKGASDGDPGGASTRRIGVVRRVGPYT